MLWHTMAASSQCSDVQVISSGICLLRSLVTRGLTPHNSHGLQVGMYRQAAFCWEELITMAPTHPAFLVRYADTLYTLGGQANVRTARAYYSRALTASAGRSVRALYGLVASGASDKVCVDTCGCSDCKCRLLPQSSWL